MRTCASLLLATLLLSPVEIVRAQSIADANFGKGYEHYARKQYAAARPLLQSVIEDEAAVLRDYGLYYLGRIAMVLNDPAGAQARFTQLAREYPDSRWVTDSAFQLVRIDLEEKRYDRVIERVRALGKGKTTQSARARAAYNLGRAYEGLGQTGKAFREYQNLRRRAPRSSWSRHSKERIAALRKQYPELRVRGAKHLLEEASQLFAEGDYSGAEQYYQRVLKETNFRRLSLRGLSKVYRKTHQRTKEESVLRDIARYYSGTEDAAEALARIATIQWNRDDNDRAFETFRTMKAQYPNHPQVAFATYAIGRIHESGGDWDMAIRIYQNFPKSHPRSRFRGDAAWRLAWIYYLRADYAAAHATFKGLAARPGNFNVAASFWQARTAEKLGQLDEAKHLYRRLATSPKDPYYRALGRERLADLGEANPGDPTPGGVDPPLAPIRPGSRASFHLARARALAGLSLNRFARLELNRVKAVSPDTPDVKRFLMREYAAIQAFNESLRLAHDLPYSAETLHHRFPLSYWSLVRRHAAEYDVDPFLVVALMRQESLFNPGAVSPANALGLMQLLLETARTEAASVGLPLPQRRSLFDPELNIRLGTHHLKRLLTRYSNSGVKALAAYNAGRKSVERWSKDFVDAADSEFAERIPYKETRLYVKKVLRNYWVYKQLYGTKELPGNAATGRETTSQPGTFLRDTDHEN